MVLRPLFFAVPDTNNNNRVIFVPHVAKNISPSTKRYDHFASASVIVHWSSDVWYWFQKSGTVQNGTCCPSCRNGAFFVEEGVKPLNIR